MKAVGYNTINQQYAWRPKNGLEKLDQEKNQDKECLLDGRKGISLITAAIFVMGEMAGSGVLALPRAIGDSGWGGVAVLLLCCVNAGFSGICLARCWVILEERWPEYRSKARYPYPSIGIRAVGPWMRYVISFCVNTTLIGCATVFLLLSSDMARSIAAQFHFTAIPFCHWALILAAVLCPIMWLGTPKDFWPVAVGALLSTAIACVLTVVGIGLDASAESHKQNPHSPPSLSSFFLAFGTITFSFGGASTFPTFQNDMKDRTKFPTAVIISFIGMLLLYIPVSVGGYAVYGSTLGSNILENLPTGPLRLTIEFLVSAHLFFAFLLVINTPAQEFEEILHIPHGFSLWRILVRTVLMLVVVFVAETIPHFGKILNLIGGSTIALMTYVFPPIFYLALIRQEGPWPPRRIAKYQVAFLAEIVLVGVVGGLMATYSAVKSISEPDSFTPPCYVNITANTGV